MNLVSNYLFRGYNKKYNEVTPNTITFQYLKDKCNLTNEELEKFKSVLDLILTIEKRYHVIMDDHGNSAYGAVILGQDEKGLLVFRKFGHICGEEQY